MVLQLGNATAFQFNDVNGGTTHIPANDGTNTYIPNYPTGSVSIHN